MKHAISRTLIGVAAVALLAGCDPGPTDTEYLERARTHLTGGDVRASLIEVRNAVQANPDNPDARLLQAEVMAKLGDFRGAEASLEKARQSGVPEQAVRLPLAHARVSAGEFQRAVDGLAEIPADAPDAAELHLQKGLALLGLGRIAEATTALNTARQADLPLAWAGSVRAALAAGNRDLATERAEEAVRRHPQSPDVQLAAAEAALLSGRNDDAAAAYQRALDIDSGRHDARLGLARVRLAQQRPGDARSILESLPKPVQAWPDVRLLAAKVAGGEGNWARMREEVEALKAMGVQAASLQLLGGIANLNLGRMEAAHSDLASYVTNHPGDPLGRQSLALTLTRMGQPKNALDMLTMGPPALMADPQYLSAVGTFALELGQRKLAIGYMEKAVARAPDDRGAAARLTLARVADGQSDERLGQLTDAVGSDPGLRRLTPQLIVGLLQAKRFDDAIEQARRYQTAAPQDPRGYGMEGAALAASGRKEAAVEAFRKALAIDPANAETASNLITMLAMLNRTDEAFETLRSALQRAPEDARLAEATLRLSQTDAKRTETLIAEVIASKAGIVFPRIQLARIKMAQQQARAALDAVQPLLAAHPFNPDLLEVVARARFATGDMAGGVDAMERLVQTVPDQPAPRFRLAQALIAGNRFQPAIGHLNEILERHPDRNDARELLTRALIETGNTIEARGHIARLQEPDRPSPLTQELDGLALLREGKAAEAADRLSKAAEKEPTGQRLLQLATAQLMSGNRAGARVALDRIQTPPAEVPTQLKLAMLRTSAGDRDGAMAGYEAVLKQAPDNLLALNNLANLLNERGEGKRARELAERAHALAPQQAEFKDTLGVILIAQGETQRGLTLLREAAATLSGNPTVQYNLAAALAAAGQRDEARATLDNLLTRFNTFPERDAAQSLLKKTRS